MNESGSSQEAGEATPINFSKAFTAETEKGFWIFGDQGEDDYRRVRSTGKLPFWKGRIIGIGNTSLAGDEVTEGPEPRIGTGIAIQANKPFLVGSGPNKDIWVTFPVVALIQLEE